MQLLATLALLCAPAAQDALVVPATKAPVVADPTMRIVENYVNPDYARPRRAGRRSNGLPTGPGIKALGDPQLANRQDLSLSLCYDNSRSGTAFWDTFFGTEIVDQASKQCGSSNIVGRIGAGIRTENLPVSQGGPGWTIGLRIYMGTGSGPGPLVADYTLSGDGVPFPTQPAAYIVQEMDLPTPIYVGDYGLFTTGWLDFHWSYYRIEAETDPLLVTTTGGGCGFTIPDPLTATRDCLVERDLATGTTLQIFETGVGLGSLYLQMWEEDPFEALTADRNHPANVLAYTAEPIVIGQDWDASVSAFVAGHSTSLLFGFDTPSSLVLGGGQVLLVADLGGSGEMLGLGAVVDPVADFVIPVPYDLSLVGRYVGTQAIVWGGGGGAGPFRLTNAIDCTIGTY